MDFSVRQHLDALGLLRQCDVPAEYAWLDDCDKQLLLSLYLYKDSGGMHKSEVQKWSKQTIKFRKAEAVKAGEELASEDCLLLLEARQLVTWEKDTQGRSVYLTLTWKGEDLAALLLSIARNENNRVAR